LKEDSELQSLRIKNESLQSLKSRASFYLSDQYPLQKKEQLKKRVTLSKYVFSTELRYRPPHETSLEIDIETDRESFSGGGAPPNTRDSLSSPVGFESPLQKGGAKESFLTERVEEEKKQLLESPIPTQQSVGASSQTRTLSGSQRLKNKFKTIFTNYGEEEDPFAFATNIKDMSPENQKFVETLHAFTEIETNLKKYHENILTRNLNSLQKAIHTAYSGIQNIYALETSKDK